MTEEQKRNREAFRKVLVDELPRILEDEPGIILSAIANNEEAMRTFMEKHGFSVTERQLASVDMIRKVYREEKDAGVIMGGFGARFRRAAESVRYMDPITGKPRQTYIFGEVEELTKRWIDAFLSKDFRNQQGESVRELTEELNKRVERAPSSPLTGDIGEAGSALVPTQVAAEIYTLIEERFVLRGLVEVFTSATPLEIPRETSDVSVTRGAAATNLGETRATVGSVRLSPERVGALTYISPRLAAAASVGPVRYVLERLARAIAKDDQRVIVAGEEGSREPRGVVNLPTSGGNSWDRAKTQAYDNTSKATERASFRDAMYSVSQGHREADRFRWVAAALAISELTSHNDADQKPWDDGDESYLRRGVIETSAITHSSTSTVIGGDWSQYAWLESPAGLILEQTNVGGEAWESYTTGVRAVQEVDGAPVLPNAFVHVTAVG